MRGNGCVTYLVNVVALRMVGMVGQSRCNKNVLTKYALFGLMACCSSIDSESSIEISCLQYTKSYTQMPF